MNKVILIRYGEIFLKGKNFGYFEKTLINNIKEKLSKFNCELTTMNKRFFVENYSDSDERKIIESLKTVFGIHSLSKAIKIQSDRVEIETYISTLKFNSCTFRVTVNRADKRFPISSMEYGSILGGIILKNNPKLTVDLHNPDMVVNVDIRDNDCTFVFYDYIDGLGGMPVSTSGRGLLLLSGGIDSPVAGYMMAKRGMSISALHFHSYPYTSEEAKLKVIKLANIVSKYTGHIKLFVVNFKEIQEEIHKHCNSEFMITLMRRIMYRIAERISLENNLQCIITGENLGQVASQTVESMTVTNDVVKNIPIFRPLIAFDKEEITSIARNIDTYETSILPYEDCCTVFLPKHPLIKPKIDKCEKEESKLDLDKLINNALSSIEIIEI